MADQMKPTPRSPILGLFSDIVNLPLQYMSSPERTQQMQGTAEFLYGTGIPKTLERMSYGDSLFSGAGMTLRPKEETINAAMNVAPFAPAVGRLAGRVVKATEGLPVGMSIKDVGKNIFEDATKYHQKVPEIKSINVAKLKRMNAGEVADVSDEVAAKMDFSEPIKVSVFADGELRIVDGHHRVAAAKKLGIQSLPVELQAINAKGSTLNKLAQEATYPQQAALDLAQQRAALPVEQGGLGLPPNNTPLDRAKAMGFGTEAYHGTNASDITKFDLVKSNRGEGTSVALTPENAQVYGNITYPLKINQQKIFDPTNKDQFKELKNYVENLIQQQKPYDKDTLSFYPFTSKKVLENLSNPQTGAYYLENEIISKSLKDLGYSGSIGMESGQSQLKIFDPDLTRSRFAAFDPFRKDVATATAMGVALPDLLAQPVNQYQQTYETTPMYTDPFGNTIGSSIR